jgi:hypothetical protein
VKRPKIGKSLTEKEVAESFKKSKEKRVKGGKSYEIYKASQKPWHEYNAIDVDGRRLEFGKQTNALRVRDKKLAMDIRATLGGKPGEADVVVVEVDDVPARNESGRKSFIIPAPWKEYEE